MRFLPCISLACFVAVSPAFAQSAPSDHIKIDITRAELQLIGQGLMELPYKAAAPVLNSLQAQLNAADQAVAKSAADAKAKTEDSPKVVDIPAAAVPAK